MFFLQHAKMGTGIWSVKSLNESASTVYPKLRNLAVSNKLSQ